MGMVYKPGPTLQKVGRFHPLQVFVATSEPFGPIDVCCGDKAKSGGMDL